MVFSQYFVGINLSWIQFWSAPKSIRAFKVFLKSWIFTIINAYHFWKCILVILFTKKSSFSSISSFESEFWIFFNKTFLFWFRGSQNDVEKFLFWGYWFQIVNLQLKLVFLFFFELCLINFFLWFLFSLWRRNSWGGLN